MSITIALLQPRVELVFADDDVSLASLIDADTVLGTTPGTTGLAVLAAATQADAQAAIGVTSSLSLTSMVMTRVAAHETALNPHRQYIGQAQAVLQAAFFGA